MGELFISDHYANDFTAAGPLVSTAELNFTNSTNDFSAAGPSNAAMPNLEDLSHYADNVGAEADTNNMESIISVSPIPTTRIHKDHLTSQIIGDLSSTTQTRSMARGVRDQGGISHVIEFGDSYEAPANVATTGSATDGTGKKKGRTVTLTTDDIQKSSKNISGNEASKKTKKNLLKQQYGNFKAEGSESLEQKFNRLQ
nr:hypothetical protein [Tanacetum cinerariifolium]